MSGRRERWSDGWSGRVESWSAGRPGQSVAGPGIAAESSAPNAADYYRGSPPRVGLQRVRRTQVEAARAAISQRDLALLHELARVRVLSGRQLERLLFADIALSARSRVRRRVLGRLVDWRLVTTLERRVGGVRAGSAGLVYSLDSGGARLLATAPGSGRDRSRLRRPATPGSRFLRHALAVSEFYVRLREAERSATNAGWQLVTFEAEPTCWWPDGLGGQLKPDAYVLLRSRRFEHAWWAEIDLGTESLPTVGHKLSRYRDFHHRGGVGADGVMPRVLLSLSDGDRAGSLTGQSVVPPDGLVEVATSDLAVGRLLDGIRQETQS